jgi:hypothetical protein
MKARDRVTQEAWMREGSVRRGKVANLVLGAQAQCGLEETQKRYGILQELDQ